MKKNNKKLIKKNTNEEKFEKWIKNKTSEILNRIILIPFCKIDYQFCYNEIIQPRSNSKMNVTFSVQYQNCYKRALLTIYPIAYKLYQDNQKEELIDQLIHEISHFHVIPLVELAKQRYVSNKEITNASEELTETIAEYIRGMTVITSDIYET